VLVKMMMRLMMLMHLNHHHQEKILALDFLMMMTIEFVYLMIFD
jgi:hypothetical protein